jgi:hypothetical protein
MSYKKLFFEKYKSTNDYYSLKQLAAKRRKENLLKLSKQHNLPFNKIKLLVDTYETYIKDCMMNNETVWIEGIGCLLNYENLVWGSKRWSKHTMRRHMFFSNKKALQEGKPLPYPDYIDGKYNKSQETCE